MKTTDHSYWQPGTLWKMSTGLCATLDHGKNPMSDRADEVHGKSEVEQPDHYTVGGFEALDVIKAKLTPEEYRGALKFNVLKYMMRANYKGSHDSDCGKARFYAQKLEDFISEQEKKQAQAATEEWIRRSGVKCTRNPRDFL